MSYREDRARHVGEAGRPLAAYEGLGLDYPWASARRHRWILEGMQANHEAGATHDSLWNAAQRELAATGTIEGVPTRPLPRLRREPDVKGGDRQHYGLRGVSPPEAVVLRTLEPRRRRPGASAAC